MQKAMQVVDTVRVAKKLHTAWLVTHSKEQRVLGDSLDGLEEIRTDSISSVATSQQKTSLRRCEPTT